MAVYNMITKTITIHKITESRLHVSATEFIYSASNL